MKETTYETLAAFATEDRIIRILAKERGKFAIKRRGIKLPKDKKPKSSESNELFRKFQSLTPPHSLWTYSGRKQLPKAGDSIVSKWTLPKRKAAARVYRAIVSNRNRMPDAEWVKELNRFIAEIQECLKGNTPLSLQAPEIIPKFKEKDPETGDLVFRPICVYSDLATKVILSLASQYIESKFDKYFHDNVLFMRSPRRGAQNEYHVVEYLDAIDLVSDYRVKAGNRPIYVGECDIQKFYDIFNHDDIIDCFEDLFEEAKRNDGATDEDFNGLRIVLKAYLESFDYPGHVMAKNDSQQFWREKAWRYRRGKSKDAMCRFKWVKKDAFISSGCYTEEGFQLAKDGGKLGIPQGGSLSCIIVNVVTRMTDRNLVGKKDPELLFIRYCDDILLMHTNKKRCEEYLDTYYDQLIAHKLVPHPRKDVSDCKSGVKTKSSFWHSKTKNVYLWGRGDGSASDWVGFLGYEMRRTGEVRIRKDKIDAEFKRISRGYYSVIKARDFRLATKEKPLSDERKEELMKKLDAVPDHILNYPKAGDNKYTRAQARRLDNYLYRKTRRAARIIGINDTKQAARERVTYVRKVKEG